MAVTAAVRAPERAMPALVLVGGCPSKQSLHHKNIANPGVPNETPQALTFSDFAMRCPVFGPYGEKVATKCAADHHTFTEGVMSVKSVQFSVAAHIMAALA